MVIWCPIDESSRKVSKPTRDSMMTSQPVARDFVKRGSFHGLLKVHPMVGNVGNELSMRQGLVRSTHDSESRYAVRPSA